MKILALDFDGVLVDSKDEIFLVGFNSYLKYFTKTALFGGQELTFDNYRDTCRQHKETCDLYWGLVHFTTRGADYGTVFKVIDDKINLETHESFMKFKHALQEGVLSDLATGFYLERHRLQHLDKKSWLALIQSYKKIIDIIAKVKDKCKIILVSNKDSEALKLLVDHFKFPFEIDALYSNELGNDKVAKTFKRSF